MPVVCIEIFPLPNPSPDPTPFNICSNNLRADGIMNLACSLVNVINLIQSCEIQFMRKRVNVIVVLTNRVGFVRCRRGFCRGVSFRVVSFVGETK